MPTPQFPAVPDYDGNQSVEHNVQQIYQAYVGISRYMTYLLSALDTLNVSRLDAKVITAGSIDAGKLAADSVTTENLQAGSVTADKMTVNELSAITANMGTLTAGTISTDATIDVGTDARIGNVLYMNETDATGTRGIVWSTVMGSSARIDVVSGDIGIVLDGFLTITPNSAQGVVINSKLTTDSLHAGDGFTGTVYVAGTPGGPTDIVLHFVDGIAVS